MEKLHIGNNAGIIWSLLNNKQSWTETQLCQETGLSLKDIYIAIGWLARENKIEIRTSQEGGDEYYLVIEYYF